MKNTKARVVQDKENPIATEIIASSIREISQGVKKIRAGSLNDKALILLLSKSSGVAQYECERVLNSLESLESTYLRKVKP